MRPFGALILLALALSGCGSPKTRFYVLSETTPEITTGLTAPCAAPPITVGRVQLPEMLDRDALVRAAAGDQLQISNEDRWAAPLDDMVQRTLAEDLRARLSAQRVLVPGDPSPSGDRSVIEVNVRQFLANATGHVTLRADWTLLDQAGKPVLTRPETIGIDGPRDSGAVARTMSRAVGILADRISLVLQGCPTGRSSQRTRA